MQSPLCNAAASAAVLSCTCAAAPGSQLPALQSSRIALAGIELCIAMHTDVSQCTLCHAQQSSKAGFHSAAPDVHYTALHHTCIALHIGAWQTALTLTLHRNAPRCNSLSACVCSGGHCTQAWPGCGGGGVRGRGRGAWGGHEGRGWV